MIRRPALALAALSLAWIGAATPAAGFEQPKVIKSKNGVLKTTLHVRKGEAVVRGKRVAGTITYNGQFPGPTLRVRPGDRMEIKMVNHTDELTNFHTHGFHVSPAGIADNILRIFKPGTTNRISIRIPHDHPNGLYWYHPHHAGNVNKQVLRGLAGLITVDGGEAEIPSLRPYRKRLLALNLTQFNAQETAIVDPNYQDDTTAVTTVNGKADQVIQMRPGQTEMWRIANMSNEAFYKLRLDGHKMWIVGLDGNPTRRAQRVRQFVIAPGQRYEVLVRAARKGTYKLKQLRHSDGFNMFPEQDLLTLRVAGAQTSSPSMPRRISSFEDLSNKKVDVRRKWTLTFGSNPFTADINGKVFDPTRIDTRARLRSVEEWTFINKTSQDHPIHLHTNDFQIVMMNGKRVVSNGVHDDYIVPRYGSIVFRFKPKTYTGTTVFHCHILFHEDVGMMATIRYVKGGPSVRVRPPGAASVHDQMHASAEALSAGAPEAPLQHSPDHHDGLGARPAAATVTRREQQPAATLLCRLSSS